MAKKVTISDGITAQRVTLPAPIWEMAKPHQACQWGTGKWLLGVHVGKKSCRVVLRIHSIWQAKDGGITGDYFELVESGDKETIEKIERIAGDDIADVVSEAIGITSEL